MENAHQQLINYITSRIAITSEQEKLIENFYSIRKLKRKEILFEQGKHCQLIQIMKIISSLIQLLNS